MRYFNPPAYYVYSPCAFCGAVIGIPQVGVCPFSARCPAARPVDPTIREQDHLFFAFMEDR
jgi:hypothetical protein